MTRNVEITARLAARLKEERKSKGLSLDALANLSGVSRSMLSQVERGESSPTIASLWNLTKALNVDFATLLDEDSEPQHPIREIVRGDTTPQIYNRAAGCSIRILSSASDVGGTEIYDITFQPDAALESAPHKTGTVEHLTVLEGRMTVRSGDETAEVSEGDTIRYAADLDHAIHALVAARALLIVREG
ncbi:XRE family transcriptional regulator [Cognatiyoonia sp. IB215182]|uniref:helix-turn-helix domain-containing protein n=1 Tax=Cognatiyoonia sp. IB215182 TaxID=3097353 RepID=UPI002A0ED962|nr:XRE family transcriptional regulator [Cognatiyoonia sp. IB215182]MDX8354519.1 XRE family transcriptional regulator [Cognatiyoonia sp. IB215182]